MVLGKEEIKAQALTFDKLLILGVLGIAALGLTGCLASTQLQEPSALPLGEYEVNVGINGFGYVELGSTPQEDERILLDGPLPGVQLGLRAGIAEKLEGYTVLGFPNGLLFGAKYQAIGDYGVEGFVLSFSADSNFIFAINELLSSDKVESNDSEDGSSDGEDSSSDGEDGPSLSAFSNINLRSYFGWNLKGNASLFIAPGVNAAYNFAQNDKGEPLSFLLPTLTLGARTGRFQLFGKEAQLCFELSSALLETSGLFSQLAVGFAF